MLPPPATTSSNRCSPIARRRGRRHHYAEYPGTDAGKTAYYMLRWVTTRRKRSVERNHRGDHCGVASGHEVPEDRSCGSSDAAEQARTSRDLWQPRPMTSFAPDKDKGIAQSCVKDYFLFSR